MHFKGIATPLLHKCCYRKFVIVFATPLLFVRVTPVSEKTLHLHSLTHTSLLPGYIRARLLYFIRGMYSYTQSQSLTFHLISYNPTYSLHHAPLRMAVELQSLFIHPFPIILRAGAPHLDCVHTTIL